MKKLIVSIAAVAALAVVPSSALAAIPPSGWGGWSTEHSDNLADEPAYAVTFGNNGLGDSRYCVDANSTTSTHCGTTAGPVPVVYAPVVFAGVFNTSVAGSKPGCSHDDNGSLGTPCGSNGDIIGAGYLGTGENGTGSSVAGTPVYTNSPATCATGDIVCQETGSDVGVGLHG